MPTDTSPTITDSASLHPDQRLALAEATVRCARDALITLDARGRIMSVNPSFTRITGFSESEALNKHVGTLLTLPEDQPQPAVFDREKFVSDVLAGLDAANPWEGEAWIRRADTETIPVLLSFGSVPDPSGQAAHFVGVFSDLSLQKEYEEKLRQAALHDPLTGLPNRTLFMERGNRALLLSERHDQGVTVIFIDLDHFKRVNDAYGHDIGDLLLMQVAERLVGCVRASDTVARLGGDEFVILLPEVSDTDKLVIVADKIMLALTEPFQFDALDHEIEISCSIGIARHPVDGADMISLLQSADESLYSVKQSGRNTYSFSSVDPD